VTGSQTAVTTPATGSVWDDLVGQDRAVAEFRAAAANPAAMSHAWLITGPPGSGRSLAALAFAAALECTDPAVLAGQALPGCGRCQGCRLTMAGTHPDVTRIATEKVTISIDEARELVADAARTPALGRKRVIVLEDADRMAPRSANVLLKAIEEPPPATVWLLCAPSVQDVLPTIRSRCRSVVLRIPTAREVAALLQRRDGAEPDAALGAALAAQSHVGRAARFIRSSEALAQRGDILRLAAAIRTVPDAVLAAGQIAASAKEEAKAVTAERDGMERAELLRVLGIAPGAAVPANLRAQVKALEDDQKRRATRAERDVLDQLLVDLLSLYRDVLVLQLGAEVDLFNGAVAPKVAEDIAGRTAAGQTVRAMDAVGQARTRLAANVPPLLALEAMFLAIVS